MNLTVLLIAAYVPLLPVLWMILRAGAFGRGSLGTFCKLFFLGIAAAVPAFLMEAGGMLAVAALLRLLPSEAFGGHLLLASAILRHLFVAALIEEGWKHFVLRVSTWEKMTLETVGDAIAASAVVAAGFSAVLYGAWQAARHILPEDFLALRAAMPEFLGAGPVAAFVVALVFIPGHFGFAGFMGALYGVAKGQDQKRHGARAKVMLALSLVLPILAHGMFAALVGYGIGAERRLWLVLGLLGTGLLALLLASAMGAARDAAIENPGDAGGEGGLVDFGDSEEFADFAESQGAAPETGPAAGSGGWAAGPSEPEGMGLSPETGPAAGSGGWAAGPSEPEGMGLSPETGPAAGSGGFSQAPPFALEADGKAAHGDDPRDLSP